MSVGAREKHTLRYIGNVRDLIAMIGAAKTDGWVLEFGRSGWRVRIVPMAPNTMGPYKVAVYDPQAIEKMVRSGCDTVVEAVTAAATNLQGNGVEAEEHKMLVVARGIDARDPVQDPGTKE